MKLRWSDGHSYAYEFSANDPASFVENGTAALRVFRAATGRRVHRGEISAWEFWGVAPELHVGEEGDKEGRWFAPCHIEKTDTGLSYSKPFRTVFRENFASTLEALHAFDAAQMRESAERWWRGCYDCWRWGRALNDLSTDVGDMLGSNHG